MAIREMRFSLDFNSPAFLSEIPRGKVSLDFFRKNRRTGQFEPAHADPDHYLADPRGIRIPSLRGVLEFWHRALLGGLPSQQIYQEQAQVFGSAEGGQGLTIRPDGMPRFKSDELCFDRDPLPLLYLGYGPLQLLQRDRSGQAVVTSHHRDKARDAIYPQESKSKEGRFRFVARGTEKQIAALKRALTLLHLFGGLGSRSRRGWGSVEVTAEGIEPPASNATPAEWIPRILAGVWTQALEAAGHVDPEFSALSRSTRIYVIKERRDDFYYDTYEAVLRQFYQRFRAVRSYRDRASLAVADHKKETGDFSRLPGGAITEVPERIAFGMPYQPGHEKQWTMEYIGRYPVGFKKPGRTVTRRASPLLLKVIRMGEKKYAGVALFLQARFFGDKNLEIGATGADLTRPFPGYGAIDAFFSQSGWTKVDLP